jgi:hypothetical protein
MTGCTSYTIVFNDRSKGPAIIQPSQDANVFKMAANRMLDEQPHQNDASTYVRPPAVKKKPSRPIPQIVESENDDEQE